MIPCRSLFPSLLEERVDLGDVALARIPVEQRTRRSSPPQAAAVRARPEAPAPAVPERPGTLASPFREALFAEFAPLVRRLVRQYGSDDPEMRQDLTGEIYYRFCVLLECFDPSRGVPLRPYLVRQLTASTYTFARHHWRRRRREVFLEDGSRLGEIGHTTDDPSRQWDHDMVMEQVRSSLPALIDRLPARQRQVVVWRYYEGRSYEEIAAHLDVRLATARSLLRHGLNNLRKWMTHGEQRHALAA